MATALHKDLPDSELHEPKGVSTAASGEVYVSDGVGSGTWQAPPAGPVGQHDLGGSEHNADTLANLNAKITDATLDDSGDPRDPNAHAASHENGGSDEIDVTGLSGVLADRQDADKIQGQDVQDATPNDGDVLVWDDGLSRWQPEPQGASANVFGLDYQTATSIGRSTTTSTTSVTKVTLTTPALTGTYRVGWTAVVDVDSIADSVEARLYNSTDAAQIGAASRHEPKDTNNRIHVGGFAEVVFTGASKSISIEYRQQGGGTAGIQDARIEIWRVS